MKIVFLGTAGGIPTKDRNVTSIGLQRGTKRWSLFDCGDGTTFQIAKTDWALPNLDSIFITHLHADHFFGILSLLFRKDNFREDNCDVTLYAPKGMREFIENSLKITKKVFSNFNLTMIEIEEGMPIIFDDMKVEVLQMLHCIPSYGFYIESMDKKIIIAGDNENPEALKKYFNGLDLLVHEATFMEEDYIPKIRRTMHTTARLLGEVAQKYELKRVIATHLSSKYSNKELVQGLYDEIALEYKGQLDLAKDFDEFEVK